MSLCKFFSKKLKIWNICVVVNLNLQYGTSKHFGSLREMSHFKFFYKKFENWEHLWCHKLKFATWYIKTFRKLTWNVTFQVFPNKKLKNWEHLCCRVTSNLQNILKVFVKCYRSSFSKRSLKIGIISVVINSNIQYGTSKHLESLREMSHFKFFQKQF